MTVPAQRRYLFLLASTRPDGNAELLARRAAARLPEGTPQQWLDLTALPLPAFTDLRHEGDGAYPEPAGHARTLLDATLDATDLVIVSPLYWYSLSAPAKLYLDHWSAWMRVPGTDFRARMAGRSLYGVSAYSGTDPSDADALTGTLRRTADHLAMGWGGVLLGSGNRPGDVLADTDALTLADTFLTARLDPHAA